MTSQNSNQNELNQADDQFDVPAPVRPSLSVEPAEPMILMSGSVYGAVEDPSALVDAGGVVDDAPSEADDSEADDIDSGNGSPSSDADTDSETSNPDATDSTGDVDSEPIQSDDGMPDPIAEDPSVDVPSTPAATTSGEDGDTQLLGGEGNDQIHGGVGDDLLKGEQGDDVLFGGAGDDLLKGGSGKDVIFGGAGNDILQGGEGNDILAGGAGYDLINGGYGHDTAVFDLSRDDYQITNVGNGWFQVVGPDGTDLVSNVETFIFADSQLSASDLPVSETEPTAEETPVQSVSPDEVSSPVGSVGDVLNGDVLQEEVQNDELPQDGESSGDVAADDDNQDVANQEDINQGDSVDGGMPNAAEDSAVDQEVPVAPEAPEPTDGQADGPGSPVTESAEIDPVVGWNEPANSDAPKSVTIDGATLHGANGGDVLWGANGDDSLHGHDGIDTLRGGAGNDRIDGGAGLDTAVFTGDFSEFKITSVEGGYRLQGPDGDDTVINVEHFQFKDRVVEAADLLAQAANITPASNMPTGAFPMPSHSSTPMTGWNVPTQSTEVASQSNQSGSVTTDESNVPAEESDVSLNAMPPIADAVDGVASNPWTSMLAKAPSATQPKGISGEVNTEGFDVIHLDENGAPSADSTLLDPETAAVFETRPSDELVDSEATGLEDSEFELPVASELTAPDGQADTDESPLPFSNTTGGPANSGPVDDSAEDPAPMPISVYDADSDATLTVSDDERIAVLPAAPKGPEDESLANDSVESDDETNDSPVNDSPVIDSPVNDGGDDLGVSDETPVATTEARDLLPDVLSDDSIAGPSQPNEIVWADDSDSGDTAEENPVDEAIVTLEEDPELVFELGFDTEMLDAQTSSTEVVSPEESIESTEDDIGHGAPTDSVTVEEATQDEIEKVVTDADVQTQQSTIEQHTTEQIVAEEESSEQQNSDQESSEQQVNDHLDASDDGSDSEVEALDLSECGTPEQGGRIDVAGGHAIVGTERFNFRDVGRFVGSRGSDVFVLSKFDSGDHYDIDGGQGDNVIEVPNVRACDANVSADKLEVDGDVRVRKGHRTVTLPVKLDIGFQNICQVKFAGNEIVDVPHR